MSGFLRYVRAPARLGQDIDVFLYNRKKYSASSESGDIGRLLVSGDLYGVTNRFGVLIHVNPMLRGPAQLQKVAENDCFGCSFPG